MYIRTRIQCPSCQYWALAMSLLRSSRVDSGSDRTRATRVSANSSCYYIHIKLANGQKIKRKPQPRRAYVLVEAFENADERRDGKHVKVPDANDVRCLDEARLKQEARELCVALANQSNYDTTIA